MSLTQAHIEHIHNTLKPCPKNSQIAVAKINDGDVCYYGAVRSDNDDIHTIENQSSIFEIGSITKVLTNAILADCVTRNIIELEDRVTNTLPFALKGSPIITYQALATHTAGLPRLPKGLLWNALKHCSLDNPYKHYDAEKLQRYLTKKLKIKHQGAFNYSNLGAGLLGYALSLMANCSYEELIKETVFKPYNMTHSSIGFRTAGERLVTGLNKDGTPAKNWDFGVLVGAGGVLSTVEDLAQFVSANFDDSNTALSLQRKTHHEENDHCLGLGWIILKKAQYGERLYFHNGGTGGYLSSLLMDMEKQNAVIVLSNLSAMNPANLKQIDTLAYALMDNIAGFDAPSNT